MRKWIERILQLSLVLLYISTVHAQGSGTDSLYATLQMQKEDTNKVNTMNEMAARFDSSGDYKSGLQYAATALTVSKKINFERGKAFANRNLGAANQGLNGDFATTLEYFTAALAYFEQVGSKRDIADCYLKIGGAYYYTLQDIPEALKYELLALKLYEETGEKRKLANCFRMLSMIYSDQGDNTEALKNSQGALKIYEQTLDSNGAAYTHNIIGSIYFSGNKQAEALAEYSAALNIYRGLGNRGPAFGIPWTYGYLGNIYENEGNTVLDSGNKVQARLKYLEALKYYELRFTLEEKGQMSHRQSYQQIGTIYADLANISTSTAEKTRYHAAARKNFESALAIATETNHKGLLVSCYFNLAALDAAEGNYKQAYDNYQVYVTYKDSLYSEESTKKSIQLRMQFDYDKEQATARIDQAKKDAGARRVRNLQYTAIALFVLLALFLFFISRQRQKAKTKIQKAYGELQATQSQLIQSEKMASLGELTAGIAHEIQNPLNFVNNFSEVNRELLGEMREEIEKGNIDEAKAIANDVIENEEKISHHGKRADSIVKGMLQHSRSSNGQRETTDINILADEYLRLAFHGLRAKDKSFNATMKTDYDKTVTRLPLVPQEIGRVILNLITNAFYAVTEKKKLSGDERYEPTVTVATRAWKDAAGKPGVEISVRDNGNGIPQRIIDKIFQPFFTTKPTGQGTGLGLSLSYDIVKTHGGQLKVVTREGEGTDFIIQLSA